MKAILVFLILCGATEAATYQGPWTTFNRPLNGLLTAVVTPTAKDTYQGRFYGVWQGVSFDYTVTFKGPKDDLVGEADIDFAHYKWRGYLTDKGFNGNFIGDRYDGSFRLKRIGNDDEK